MNDTPTDTVFALLTEIGIIAQLAGNAFERRMPGGLRLAHFSVLNHLARVGGQPTPLELARAMQVTKGAMTNTIGHLERGGLVEILAHESDGRSKRVRATEAGLQARLDTIARLRPELEAIARALPPDAPTRALPALQGLRRHLDRNR